MKESKWFSINTPIASREIKDVFNHYKKYIEKSRKQTQYLKNNFSFDKMGELIRNISTTYIDKNITVQVPLKLPKLKKIELPKLKKVEA